jgi:hypothetical protein
MEIIWHGHSFFEIGGKTNQEKIIITIDPFDEKIGLKPRKVKADILLISHQSDDYLNKEIVQNSPFLIEEPGEYEVKNVKIKGIASFYDKLERRKGELNTIFIINIEGIKVCHMGNNFSETQVSEAELEDLFGVDVLLIPIGGELTISGKEAARIIGQVEPKIVIPMHYKIPGLKLDLEDEKPFLRAIGIKEKEKIKKLKIKKNELQRDGTEVVLLEPI